MMGTILSWKTNLAAAIRKIGIGLAGIGRFPGYTLWYYYTIYRVISDRHTLGPRNIFNLEWSEKSGVSPELLGRISGFRKIRNLLGVRVPRDFLFIRSGV